MQTETSAIDFQSCRKRILSQTNLNNRASSSAVIGGLIPRFTGKKKTRQRKRRIQNKRS